MILALGVRTLTGVLRNPGVERERRCCRDHRGLGRAVWPPGAASRLLLLVCAFLSVVARLDALAAASPAEDTPCPDRRYRESLARAVDRVAGPVPEAHWRRAADADHSVRRRPGACA